MIQPGTAAEPGRAFYVTVIDGSRVGFLAGPYKTHEAALAAVDTARRLANDADPRAHWYAFGTAQAVNNRETVFGLLKVTS